MSESTAGASALLNAAMLRWFDELSNQGIFTTDTTLAIRSWNRWMERHSEMAAQDVIGRSVFEVCPELKTRGLDTYYRAAIAGEVSVLAQPLHRYLLHMPGRLGSPTASAMPQSSRIAPLLDSNTVVGTITVIEDVSERVNSEAEMRRQIAASEDTLRIKDEFLATLSHEIRTPLNAVIGWTKILLGRTVDTATLDRALRVIDRNATAQARLIEDMLDMARIVSGKLRLELAPVDLVASTLAAIDVVAPAAAAKGVVIRTAFGRAPRAVIADADRVQQIVWNLLSNAVKFTPAAGSIDVRIEDGERSLRLVIADTGQGIAPEFLPYVFERFRQANASTSRSEGGLGLGLALVRQLVELHGGRITAESPGRGKGATFTVTFPAPSDELVSAGQGTTTTSRRVLESIRVMVVDDDPDWRDLLSLALTEHGAEVLAAASTADALALLANATSPPRALIADIGLPGEDGYALLDALRRLRPQIGDIPAIAVTAYVGQDNQRRALAAGFKKHYAKPIAPDAVAIAVLEVIRGSSSSSSSPS
jgi:PAS domain S-box-containing protein